MKNMCNKFLIALTLEKEEKRVKTFNELFLKHHELLFSRGAPQHTQIFNYDECNPLPDRIEFQSDELSPYHRHARNPLCFKYTHQINSLPYSSFIAVKELFRSE